MDIITQDIICEALNGLEDRHETWIKAKHSSDAEKELSRHKLLQIHHARQQLTELLRQPPR